MYFCFGIKVMSYAAFSYTTLREILARTKIALGILDGTLEDIQLQMHLMEGAKEMMTAKETVELTFTLEICDFKAKLPCEFIELDRKGSVVFTTNGEVDNDAWWNNWNMVYTGQPFLSCSPYNGACDPYSVPVIEVQDGYLFFSNNITATEVTISCLCLLVDQNGDMKIPEINARPIEAYGYFMYGSLTGTMTENNVQRWERIWTNGKMHRRAKAKIPDAYMKQAIGRVMNRLLN